jgi:hypothetical protein
MDYDEKIEKLQETVKKILLKHHIRMSIAACGCCDSPWVTFEYKGKKIVEDQSPFKFDMFEQE